MNQIDPTTPVAATLAAQEWNIILEALNNAPYRVAAPLISKLLRQFAPQPGDATNSQ